MQYSPSKPIRLVSSLWKLRYRFVAIIVLLMSIFVFNSDTATAVRVVIPEEGLNYRVVERNFATSVVEFRQTDDPFSRVESIMYSGGKRLAVMKGGSLYQDDNAAGRLDTLGYTFAPPSVDLDGAYVQPNAQHITLNDLIPAPTANSVNRERVNFLEYPRFSIKTPIILTVPTDVYHTNPDGTIDYMHPIMEDEAAYFNGNYESTPVLRKLLDGVVLLNGAPFIPLPGELGNSFIVGHGPNYANTSSPYARIFERIEKNGAKVGDEIYIWDSNGRKLTFEVFRSDIINNNDAEAAYGQASGEWNNRRIISLQTCILEWTSDKGIFPTKRLIIRAELKL